MEMVVQGVSTRKVSAITEELCGASFSKSTVSALCAGLDARVRAFNERRLDAIYPFLLVDALFIKSRDDDRVVSRAALIVSGIRDDGIREILGVRIGDTESFATWDETFRWLKARGLAGVMFVISDNHGGLTQDFRHFQGASSAALPGPSAAQHAVSQPGEAQVGGGGACKACLACSGYGRGDWLRSAPLLCEHG